MTQKSISELRDLYRGSDIWVICSGASMDYVEPSFFSNKVTIGVNDVYKKFPCTFYLRKDFVGSGLSPGPLIVAEYDCAAYHAERNTHGQYVFKHRNNEIEVGDPTKYIEGDDWLVTSASVTTSAMHMAAYMGAKNILLCGHDCGILNDHVNFHGYADHDTPWYTRWVLHIERESLMVKEWLKRTYGVNIYSLNPFLNFGLEGHQYIGCRIAYPDEK